MYEIDNEKFGIFLAQLRKQKDLTQKELAQRLFVSDKAVSKWERGLSMPDIALLSPLADLLGVTITELLSGQRISGPGHLNVPEVEKIVAGTICLFAKETLPAYYDENKISFYSDGIFRTNMAGVRVHLNNSNWPYVLRAGRLWMSAAAVPFPLLYSAVSRFFPAVWTSGRLFFILLACLGFFVPMIAAGKRHE